MSLKQIINRSKMLGTVIDTAMELPGEPMIYSVKYPVGQRTRGVQFFRNMKWRSFLKTFFRSFYRTTTPLVLIVRFYVTPPLSVHVSSKSLRSESVPAVMCYELCDYTLSFLEMLHHVLFNSYKQVVKLDVEKYYSANPRTTVKFMKWDEYVNLQNRNTPNTKAKSIRAGSEGACIQPERKGDEGACQPCSEGVTRLSTTTAEGTASCDSAFRVARTVKSTPKKKRTAKLHATPKETGRGQSGEVSK